MFVHVDPPSIDFSQWSTFPVKLESATDPLLDPVHTVSLPVTVPPVAGGETSAIETDENAAAQFPFCTRALNWVVEARFWKFSEGVEFGMESQETPPLAELSQYKIFPD